jgi:hypothetical protein
MKQNDRHPGGVEDEAGDNEHDNDNDNKHNHTNHGLTP